MSYTDPVSGQRAQVSLGRLAEPDVPNALREKVREVNPGVIADDGTGIRTLDALLEAWAAWVESRGPDGSKQLAPLTVKAYVGCATRMVHYVRNIDCRTLDRDRYRSIREARDRACSARRTVNADMKALQQALIWGREKGIAIPMFRTNGITTMFVDDSHRVNNHRTPTPEEVEKVLRVMRTTPSKLAVFVAWKTGARISEVTRWAPDKGPDGGLPIDSLNQRWVYFPKRKNAPWGKFPISPTTRNEILSLLPMKWKAGRRLFTASLTRNVTGTLAQACVRAGVPVFTCHGLRRLMDDTMLRRGVELGTYADLMDHTAETALRHYRRPNDDDRATALAKIESRGENLTRWLARHGLTEDQALDLLKASIDEPVKEPHLRLVE